MKDNNKTILIRDKSSNNGAVYRSTNIRDLKKSDVVKVNKEYHSKKVVENTEVFNPLKFVLGFILLGILVISLFRITGYFGNGTPLTFAGFLDFLSNLNFDIVNFDIGSAVIDGNWGILDFFRIFLNSIMGIFRFTLSICSALINVVIFLFNIGKFILYGA